MSKSLQLSLRAAVSLALLGLMAYLLPVEQVVAAIRQVPPMLWLGALAVTLVGHLVAALKWRVLIASTIKLPVHSVVRAHFAGLAAGLFLPGLVAGDVVRAGWLGRRLGSWEKFAVSGVIDRLLDMAALLMLACLGIVWTAGIEGVVGQVFIAGLLLVGLAAAGIRIAFSRFRRAERDGSRARIAEAADALQDRPWRSVAAFALSLVIQVTFVAVCARLGAAVGLEIGLGAWLAAWPLAKIASILPFTFGGLGTREGALIVLMRAMGAPAPLVAATGVVWASLMLACGISAGLVAWMMGRPSSRLSSA